MFIALFNLIVYCYALSNSSYLQISRPPTPSFKLYYELHGQGPTKLLLIMGLGFSLEGWIDQVKYFGIERQDEYTVLVYDNRGIGFTDTVFSIASTSEFAKDASDLLDHVGLR